MTFVDKRDDDDRYSYSADKVSFSDCHSIGLDFEVRIMEVFFSADFSRWCAPCV